MFDTLAILINGITLALAAGLLLIVLWHDVRKEQHQYFAVFLIMVMLWNAGALMTQMFALLNADSWMRRPALIMMELGFSGASVAVFALTAALARAQSRSFRMLAFASLAVILVYRAVISLGAEVDLPAESELLFNFQEQPLLLVFYLLFDGATLYLIWRHRHKIRAQEIVTGVSLFIIGQSISFLNPDLRPYALSTIVSSVAALVTSFAILKLEILNPLAERMSQVETIHRVSLAMTSQIALDTVLEQIATQAAQWLRAEAVGIWLYDEGQLELTTVHNLPEEYLHRRLALGQGVIGTVAQARQAMHLEDYRRDWGGAPDLPVARETFGSVIAAPLTYGQAAIGALMVIAARDGRWFDKDDVHLLELLGAQAAVAIANSHSFAEQRQLAEELEFSRSQLETVLKSTQNPVIAVNRKLSVIFANPVAQELMSREHDSGSNQPRLIYRLFLGQPQLPLDANTKSIVDTLHRRKDYKFELDVEDTVYLCYVTALRHEDTDGWVAILNDITHLKELDRIKSEMMRMTSHDLKNPLQAAMVNLDLLRDDLEAADGSETARTLDVIERQLMRMNRIIRGILDLERARSGNLKIETIEASRLMDETVDELRHFIDEGKIAFDLDIAPNLPLIACDTDQLKRALVNLVENAFKFTPVGGRVRFMAKASKGSVRFAIEDSGVGIPVEAQPRVFDRFFRVNQAGTEHVSGSGLGLSLVKTIVENHKGTIWLESTPGTGTTFYVELPAGGGTNGAVGASRPE
ncbi:MAG: GAF domain-containing sensor histidine kinase [Anaerolineae bacterium]|nr:GAF domain-containing sensor histidine kinase [Anaerolineae bacterium]